ncbi:MAG: hypothetical protein L6R41_001819 [Letrouitia leprolyta]|nr:MAG: hypothetical protein L6R41_001819 [Letrouitia leprolyta]
MCGIYRTLFSLLFLLSVVSSAPTKPGEKSFKIQSRRISSRSAPNGAAALGKAYRKYGWEVPDAISKKVATIQELAADPNREEGTVKATPEEGDASFLSPVKIGEQTLMLNFDTGSSDLWVFNTNLRNDQTQGHSVFDPKKSSTFKPMGGASFKISYGDSSAASGTVGTDTVDVGGAKVEGQAVELATTITNSFLKDVDSDGLVGLAFGSINTVKPRQQKTFFENVMTTLDKPVFTANLRHHTVGSYEFGRIDSSQFIGDITYTSIDDSQGFWQIESKSYAVGDGQTQTNPSASPAIMDTGTSLMLADDAVVRSYWRQVEGAEMDGQGVTFPCDSQLPDFHIALGPSYMATVPGELMNYQRLGRNTCFGGLQSNMGQPLQIYGDVLFKSQFVVFDGGNKAVGFAPHR